jgi:tripartite-type tricarboxylate transporter receptor subunit TctC
MLRVLEAPLSIGQAFYVAKEVPKDRTAALREAFRKMLADPQFIAEADKSKLFVNPLGHNEIAKIVSDVFATPPRLFAELEAVIAPK